MLNVAKSILQKRKCLTADDAVYRLKQGNLRFVNSHHNPNTHLLASNALTQIHEPFAIILGCSDARVPAEIVFDQGLGDLFVIRVAGNVVAPSQIGSIEFAAEKFGTKLVVVLGHSNCGAVTACVDTILNPEQSFSPNLKSIVDRIRPSIHNIYELYTNNQTAIEKQQLIDKGIKANVLTSVSQLKHSSKILEDAVNQGSLRIVGATYDLETGRVHFFNE